MKIHNAAVVLTVSDLDVSLRYFVDTLGFREDFRFGQYAGIKYDACCIHLSLLGNPNTTVPGAGVVYIFCDDVDNYYTQIRERGAVTDGPPHDYEYGIRDFIVRDPDGNQLTFGSPVNENKDDAP
ncbi:MAG TPA: VOC family protein [Planctomicrobium sp.]|nr:VOC family protein [Planctomicrobium sp.]